jgi:hypothetical protein
MVNEVFVKNALAPLILRLVLALVFIYHGWTKVTGPPTSGSSRVNHPGTWKRESNASKPGLQNPPRRSRTRPKRGKT